MNYYQNHKLKVKRFFFIPLIMILLSVAVKASEKTFDDDILVTNDEQNISLLAVPLQNPELSDYQEDKPPCCLLNCFKSKFSWLFFLCKCTSHVKEDKPFITDATLVFMPTGKFLNLPSGVILRSASFLDHFDQLRVSHVNKEFRREINEIFWERQILEQRYLLWDTSLPKAKVFFANYFYHKGFGRDPKLPERISNRVEEIILLPNLLLAKKALVLGFPKGQENYRQVQHKIIISKISREREASRFSVTYSLSPYSYQLLSKKQ